MKIKDLLTDETKWTKGARARDINCVVVDPNSDSACRWSLYGAIVKCYAYSYDEIYAHIGKELGTYYVNNWNDNPKRHFTDVRELVVRINI